MKDNERLGKIETAAALLDVLKRFGCPASEVSKETGVPTSTISHWRAVDSVSGRSVGAPSDETLVKLVGMVQARFIENLYKFHELLSSGYLGHSRLYQTLQLVAPHFDEASKRLGKQLAFMEQYQRQVRRLSESAADAEHSELLAYLVNHNTEKWGPSVTLARVPGGSRGGKLTQLMKKACLPLAKRSVFIKRGLDATRERVHRLYDGMEKEE